jgi:4-aminobutyrate aminotransferase-like enzyme/Ser/Thr protein kinase RdoA (MazF antagonist)
MLEHAPRFDAADAAALARDLFGVDGTVTPLPSERDQNFLIDAADGRVVLKIANGAEARELLEAQNAALECAAELALSPRALPALDGRTIVRTAQGHDVRLLSWIDGRPLADVQRRSAELMADLGIRLASLDARLLTFDHPAIHRDFYWDLAAGLRTIDAHVARVRDHEMRGLVAAEANRFARVHAAAVRRLRRSAIHNDANDYNVLVADSGDPFLRRQRVAGLIDFGDIVHSMMVGDLAVAIAYAILRQDDPLAAAAAVTGGYNSAMPLGEEEVASLLPLVKLRLCMSVAIAAEQAFVRPGDEYLSISQEDISRILPRLARIPEGFAEAALRRACGLDPVPAATRLRRWLDAVVKRPVLPDDRRSRGVAVVDLSVGSPLVAGGADMNREPELTARIAAALEESAAGTGVGRYGEPRLLYTTPLFAGTGGERRTVHLGVDLFVPSGTPIRAPLDGTVRACADNRAALDYGPVILLEHKTDQGDRFFTLYGHLTRESIARLRPGDPITAGAEFAHVGSPDVNGGWPPHVHIQIIADLLGLDCDFPGVCRPSEREIWEAISPDPEALLQTGIERYQPLERSSAETASGRATLLPRNLSVAYRQPVKIVRGWMQYLFDESGRRFLDAYNNVPHVGHCHPEVARAIAEQTRVLNTNTRYLHDALSEFAAALAGTMPDPLRVCFFVNSGSEANELALRLARTFTGSREVIVLESAYHGNTTTMTEISPYKFDGPGGCGREPWVHVASIPDEFRGRYRRAEGDVASKYASDVTRLVDGMRAVDRRPCAFIAETCPSVAGQILLPQGYLKSVYTLVRAAGGMCIADEVQTAYGRMGSSFYAFEDHGVVPDILVLGKPIGNGYPIGAVITTEAVAAAFDNGLEFFSTFGGSTVSCRAGLAVLDLTRRDGLQAHADRVGARLAAGFNRLAARHPLVGDVRGSGLFWGLELVEDTVSLEPATAAASYVVNRLREEGVLIGSDGPRHNVLKIRPPMPFDAPDADLLLEILDAVLGELAP